MDDKILEARIIALEESFLSMGREIERVREAKPKEMGIAEIRYQIGRELSDLDTGHKIIELKLEGALENNPLLKSGLEECHAKLKSISALTSQLKAKDRGEEFQASDYELKDIQRKINDQLLALRVIKKTQEATIEDWKTYKEIHQNSQKLFADFLGIMSGIAFRGFGFERSLCRIPIMAATLWADVQMHGAGFDETMSNLAEKMLKILRDRTSLEIDSVAVDDLERIGRLIRIRLPGNFWNLPIIAHDFGYSVAMQIPGFKSLLEKYTGQKGFQLRLLLADCLGVFFLGPAYAYNAIYLRLNPDFIEDKDVEPIHFNRSAVIIHALNTMNDSQGGAAINPPYTNACERIQRDWFKGLKQGQQGGGGEVSQEWKTAFDEIYQFLTNLYQEQVYKRSDTLMGDIKECIEHWSPEPAASAGNQEKVLKLIENFPASKGANIPIGLGLIDILNGAWELRMDEKKDLDVNIICKNAVELCSQWLMFAERGAQAQRGRGGPSTRERGFQVDGPVN